MIGIRNRYKLAMIILVSVCLMNLTTGYQYQFALDKQNKFTMDQAVKGNGFFNSNLNIINGNLQLDRIGHGSGSFDYMSKTDNRRIAGSDSQINLQEQRIAHNEGLSFSYAPTGFNIGKSFKAVVLQNRGEEKTSVKNYAGSVSMTARFDSLDMIHNNLSANLYSLSDIRVNSWTTKNLDTYLKQKDTTKLNVDANFTGNAHIGAFMLDKSVHNVTGLMDEDYIGSFHIVKKLSQDSERTIKGQTDDWLPCCTGGYLTMPPSDPDQKANLKSVFDCSCPQAQTKAEFSRVYS